MRINKFVAQATGMSRRKADVMIAAGRVTLDGKTADTGASVTDNTLVRLDEKPLKLSATTTIMLNKPAGYVCSRDGQGSQTIYELLPEKYHHLKPVGRLDKYSSGLLLLTNDGELANRLTHPSYQKEKIYEVRLDRKLDETDQDTITTTGVQLEDGVSKFEVTKRVATGSSPYVIKMHEGRNRQIRRTFEALGYRVNSLHRTHFGSYTLSHLPSGGHKLISL